MSTIVNRIIATVASDEMLLYKVYDEYLVRCQYGSQVFDSRIADYLNKIDPIVIHLNTTADIFSDKKIRSNETFLSDGHWVWSGDLNYYYEHYNFRWPVGFVESIAANSYEVPILNEKKINELVMICSDIKKNIFGEVWTSNNPVYDIFPEQEYLIRELK